MVGGWRDLYRLEVEKKTSDWTKQERKKEGW
jgi:hypothetical protein